MRSHLLIFGTLICAGACVARADEPPSPDSVERFLILAPGGPVVVEATILLDGKPFRAYQEGLVDAALKEADTDGDGKATWDEALANPRFLPGQAAAADEAGRKLYVRRYDRNDNGVLDRAEARMLVAQSAGGPAFQVTSRMGAASRPDVMGLFDADRDGVLSQDEIAAAPARLRERDVSDNDLVELDELDVDALAAYKVSTRFGRVATGVRIGTVYALGDAMNPVLVNYGLKQRYGKSSRLTADCFPLFPELVKSVDRNGNGELDADELPELNRIPPHVAVTVRIGATKGPTAGPQPEVGIRLTSVAREFTSAKPGKTFGGQAALEVPGARLLLAAVRNDALDADFETTAANMVSMFDSDKNGYLEKQEIEDQENDLFLQFDRNDANGDGKVYPEELAVELERINAPQRNRLTVSSGDRGTALYATLDRNGDGRIGLREMRQAAKRLATLDASGDGRLAPDEIPREIAVSFFRGSVNDVSADFVSQAVSANPDTAPVEGPRWFRSMDRNGDGDVSPREFLGTREQFRAIDTDEDGLIDPAEAEAAKR